MGNGTVVSMRVLVTGAAGFIGSHLCEELVARHHEVVALDALTYAGDLENLKGVKCEWICHDFSEPLPEIKVDAIVHVGAESHVDNAFENPSRFISSNLIGTLNVLELARKNPVSKFIYVSTDEVFGESFEPRETGDRLAPTNPYSATKAGAEHLVWSYYRSFGVPVLVTRSCNVFGPRQHPEKFIPATIDKILHNEMIDVHTGLEQIGVRRWCHVSEVARALAFLLEGGVSGQVYHISEGTSKNNLEIAEMIADALGYPLSHRMARSPRSSYDENYWLAESRYASCWKVNESFEAQLNRTVAWYLERAS